MEKIKCIYIICFILQVISFPVIGYLLGPMIETTSYHSFYCTFENLNPKNGFWGEFQKLFPNDYNHYCRDYTFDGLGLAIISYLCGIILFIILIMYIVNFCNTICSGLILDKGSKTLFIISLIFLLPIIILYLYLTPFRTSFDKPELIYIFDTQLNERIEEMVKTVIERKIYGVIGLLLIFLVIGTTLTQIYILKKGKEKTALDAKFILNQISPNDINKIL